MNLLQTSEHPPVHLHMENFEKATDDFRIVVVKVAKKIPRQKEKNKS